MKICSWNINSINVRKSSLIDWLKENTPDIMLLQEIKCLEHNFPKEGLEELGYNVAVHGQKGFNGVAILSKHPFDEVITTFPEVPLADQARYIEAVISAKPHVIRVASVYVPNGQTLDSDKYQYKIEFLEALSAHMKNLLKFDEIQVIGGDFNIARQEIDTYSAEASEDTVLFAPKMRELLSGIINLGWHDLFRCKHPREHQYSWWDYRGGAWHRNKGLRLDYLFGSPEALDVLESAEIDQDERGKERASDHAPVSCCLKFS